MFNEHTPATSDLTPDLAAVERHLARLRPSAPHIDRDCFMFEAGRSAGMAAQRPCGVVVSRDASRPDSQRQVTARLNGTGARRWFWPAMTAAMTVATLLLATLVVWQRGPQPVAVQQPLVPQPTPTVAAMPQESPGRAIPAEAPPLEVNEMDGSIPRQSTAGYLQLRQIVLTRGIAALDDQEFTTTSTHEPSQKRKATQRELLRELLPVSAAGVVPRT